jgi:cysteine desulfurase
MSYIYLDHHAATPVLPEVFEAMRPYYLEQYGNPSSFHRLGLAARDALDRARSQVATFINAEAPETIIFTSGGTEAINLAIKGAALAAPESRNHLVISAIEHPAVLQSVEALERGGFSCSRIPVDGQGRIDPVEIQKAVTGRTILVAVHHANHEIGTIEPIEEIGRWTRAQGMTFFVDATMSAGWLPIDVQRMGIDLLSLSPHRFYGPKGVGVLYCRRRTRIKGIIHGGVQEEGLRAGTENVPGIVGAGLACELARQSAGNRGTRVSRLQHELWSGLSRQISDIRLNGPVPGADRLPNNLHVGILGVEGEAVVLRCDLKGVALASGPSCLGRSPRISHVLTAIGLDHPWARGSVVISLGLSNDLGQIQRFVNVLADVVCHLRTVSPEWNGPPRADSSAERASSAV